MKELVLKAVIVSVTRHVVGALGAIGITGAEVEQQVAGSLALLVAVAWSLYDRIRARKAAALLVDHGRI